MTIHASDPFATPESGRSPVRRLRGRLPAAVTLWTARHPATGPAGLTVSSTVVVDGDPGRLLGVLDDESDLWTAIEAAGAFTVVPLTDADRRLADRFAGLFPAPGGLFGTEAGASFGWVETSAGPVPAHLATWAVCRLDAARPFGWGLLVEATLTGIQLGDPPEHEGRSGGAADALTGPLVHHRGRYRALRETRVEHGRPSPG